MASNRYVLLGSSPHEYIKLTIGAGGVTELMGDLDGAMQAYEQALRHNQWSIPAMNGISAILRTREMFPKAVEYLLNISKLDPTNDETWGSLGSSSLFVSCADVAY